MGEVDGMVYIFLLWINTKCENWLVDRAISNSSWPKSLEITEGCKIEKLGL